MGNNLLFQDHLDFEKTSNLEITVWKLSPLLYLSGKIDEIKLSCHPQGDFQDLLLRQETSFTILAVYRAREMQQQLPVKEDTEF